MKMAVAALILAVGVLLAPPASAQNDAIIMLIHGIPDANVDIVVDGSVVLENFAFGDVEDLSAFSGQTLKGVTVKLAGTGTATIEVGDLAMPTTGNYSIVAHLDSIGNATLTVFENDTSTIAPGAGRLVIRHTAAAPAVDVLANGAVAFSDVTNGTGAQADLPADTIAASLVPTGETEPVLIGPTDAAVTEGESLVVYAVGSIDDDTLAVLSQRIGEMGSAPNAVNTGNSPVGADGRSLALAGLVAVASLLAVGLGIARITTTRP